MSDSRDHVVVAPTGFLPYFLYAWDDDEPRWLTRRDLAVRFTAEEARRVADKLNARWPVAVNHVRIERIA